MKKFLNGKYSNIYLALFICLAAVALAATVSLKVDRSPAAPENESFVRETVIWSETAEPTDAVDIGVTGVRDDREETVAEETTQNNLPYSGSFILPMGTQIIKDYSNGEMVKNETMGDWRVHNGVDFGGTAGNTVSAVADGTVIKVYSDSFWGTVAEVDHGNGMTVRYCGLKESSCAPQGTELRQGDKVGTLGHIPIETVDGEHLHLEVMIDGKYVDPLAALNKVIEQ